MIKNYYVLFCLVFIYSSYAVQPAWDHLLDFHAIEKRLAKQEIAQLVPMREYLSQQQEAHFSHEVYLAHNTLWIKRIQKTGPSYTKVYYRSTLDRCRKLTKKTLEAVWSFWRQADRSRVDKLIQLILERRDQLLHAAHTSGRIL